MKRKKADIKISKLTTQQLEEAIKKENYKSRYILLLKNTIFTIVVIFAFCILLVTLIMPVFEIKGDSMAPIYNDGNVVVAFNMNNLKTQDIIAFNYGNKILVKRVIATEGKWVNIKDDTIYVDGEEVFSKKDDESFDYGDIEYPYQVPSGQLFVLSDNKENLQDSRNSQIGCVKKDDILGKVLFKLW